MTSRLGLIALAGLATLALTTAPADAQTTRSTGGVVFSDILVSSIRGGRTVATTRTDGQGRFDFDLPAGSYDICLNGPGLRSVIDRSGGSQGEDHAIAILIGLLLPAVQTAPTERQLPFPAAAAGPGQGQRRGPSPAARDLCFPYAVDAASGQTTRGQRVMPDGSIIGTGDPEIVQAGPVPADMDGDGRPDRDFNGQDPADGRGAGRVQVAAGDVNGDGRADRRVDPRIPPPDSGRAPGAGIYDRWGNLRATGAREASAGPATAPTVAVTGTVSLVR